jgi:outer membrane protein assembly factor BamB
MGFDLLKRKGWFALLLGLSGLMTPRAVWAQGMMGRPVMGEETTAIGSDGTLYVVASPAQRQMGPEFGRVALFALDPATFRVRWRYVLEEEDFIASRPVVGADGTVYLTVSEMMEFGSPFDPATRVRNARLLAVREGALKWGYDFDAPFASHPALGPEGMVFVTTSTIGPMEPSGPWTFSRSSFFALEDRGTSATVRARLDLGPYAVSAPVVGPHPTSPWAVYVTGEGGGMGPGMGMGSGTVLFVISSDFRLARVSLR